MTGPQTLGRPISARGVEYAPDGTRATIATTQLFTLPNFGPINSDNGSTPGGINADTFYVLLLSQPMLLTALSIEVTTLASGGKARAAVYTANSATSLPSQLLVDSGEYDCGSTGLKTAAVTPVVLPAGRYWTALNYDNGTNGFRRGQGAIVGNYFRNGSPQAAVTAVSVARTFDAFPATAGTPTTVHYGTVGAHQVVWPTLVRAWR
jgi:hypothetical protein